MKTLSESLFDNDLVDQVPKYEKVLRGRISKDDVKNFIKGGNEGEFINIKNPNFYHWADEFYDRVIVWSSSGDRNMFAYFTWNPKNDISQEAIDWIKPGTIHKGLCWNDRMYASSLDVSWSVWGDENDWKDVTEWILFTTPSPGTPRGFNTYLLINRSIYNDIDQAIMHKLITIVSTIK